MAEEIKTENIRKEKGLVGYKRPPKEYQFKKGQISNPIGRKPETPEQKVIKKAIKEFVKEYKEKLAAALPKISPILIAKAMSGDIPAIKEINDRVMGKPTTPIDITTAGESLLRPTAEEKTKALKALKEIE